MSLDKVIEKLQEVQKQGHGKEDIEIYANSNFPIYSEIKSVAYDGFSAVEIVIE